MHDPRVGRFFAIDPLTPSYPWNSPYSFSENRVIDAVELEGLEQQYYKLVIDSKTGKTQLSKHTADKETKWYQTDLKSVGVFDENNNYIASYNFRKPYSFENTDDTDYKSNFYEEFDDFIKNPLYFMLTEKYISNEAVLSETTQEFILLILMRKASKMKSSSSYNKPVRLPQDAKLGANKPAPKALPTQGRKIGKSTNQNKAVQNKIKELESKGATDIRVDQQQVDVNGKHVGVNRPDLQYTLDGKRHYIEWDTSKSGRGPGHEARIKANDPKGETKLIIMD